MNLVNLNKLSLKFFNSLCIIFVCSYLSLGYSSILNPYSNQFVQFPRPKVWPLIRKKYTYKTALSTSFEIYLAYQQLKLSVEGKD